MWVDVHVGFLLLVLVVNFIIFLIYDGGYDDNHIRGKYEIIVPLS